MSAPRFAMTSGLLLAALLVSGAASPVWGQTWRTTEMNLVAEPATRDDCVRRAESTKREQALRAVLRLEGIHPSTESCIAEQALTAVEVNRRGGPTMTSASRCTVPASVRYDRERIRRTAESCLRTEVSAPVGVVMRVVRADAATAAETPSAALSEAARGEISSVLNKANFTLVDLPQFQGDFLDLRGNFSACAITGAAGGAGWRERCQTQFQQVGDAREAVADKLRQAVDVYSELAPWKKCGGLFVIGSARLTAQGNAVVGVLDASYYVLTDRVTFIAPYSDSRPRPVDVARGGEEQAASELLLQLANSAAKDAVLKLAEFSKDRGCEAQ